MPFTSTQLCWGAKTETVLLVGAKMQQVHVATGFSGGAFLEVWFQPNVSFKSLPSQVLEMNMPGGNCTLSSKPIVHFILPAS